MKKIFFYSFLLSCLFLLLSCNERLTILGEDSSNLQAMKQILQKEYEHENGIKLAFRPNSFGETFNKANQDFLHKTGIYDIVLQYNFSLSSYVEHDYVYLLDSLYSMLGDNEVNRSFEKDIFPDVWKEVGWYYNQESQFLNKENIIKVGYPFATNTMLLVYNKRMFNDPKNKEEYKRRYKTELQVPTDWEQFRQIAEFFTTNDTYGICMQGDADSWLYYEYCDFLYGMGASIFDKTYGWEKSNDSQITITSPEAIKATELYRSMKKYNKGAYTNVGATEQVKLILEGDVAMGLVWSDYLFSYFNSESEFDFAVIPGKHSPIAGGCFYVNKNSKNPVDAFKFILHVMQPETQVELALQGLCSPLQSTYKNKEVLKKIRYAPALYESLDRGAYMYEAGLESSEISNIITNHIQRMWKYDQVSVKETLDQIKQEINDLLRKTKH